MMIRFGSYYTYQWKEKRERHDRHDLDYDHVRASVPGGVVGWTTRTPIQIAPFKDSYAAATESKLLLRYGLG